MSLEPLCVHRDEILKKNNKTEESFEADLQILKNWIQQEPHLPKCLINRKRLLEIFLMRNKYSIEKTKRKLELYCSIRSQNSYLYEDHLGSFEISKDPTSFHLIENLTDEYYRIVIHKVYDEKRYEQARDFSLYVIYRELVSHADYNDGEIFIFDLTDSSLGILTKIQMNITLDTLNLLFKVYSARVREIHIINALASKAITFFKQFFPKKIGDRLIAHSDIESLKTSIPVKNLPKDYGGQQKSLAELRADWEKLLKNNEELLREAFNIKSDESLRIEQKTTELQGTFKKLVVD